MKSGTIWAWGLLAVAIGGCGGPPDALFGSEEEEGEGGEASGGQGSGNAANGGPGNAGNSGGAGNTGNSGGSGNAGNSGGAGNTGNSGGSGNAGNSGGAGNTGNNGGAGNSGGASSCVNVEDCGSPSQWICDPDTETCQSPAECSAVLPCAANQVCLIQAPGVVTHGACYPLCNPSQSGACGAGKQCLLTSFDGVAGACFDVGGASPGAACTSTDLSTGCTSGYGCGSNTSICHKLCNYFSSAPGCTGGQTCNFGGVCDFHAGDAAQLGGSCAAGAQLGDPCANDGLAWRGSCQDLIGFGFMTCHKTCRTAFADCPGSTCIPYSGYPEIGVCE